MSPLPARFAGRWDNPTRLSYDDSVCWHLLLGGNPAVREATAAVAKRLEWFPNLSMTPQRWLHVTVARIGPVDVVTADDRARMLALAQRALTHVAPVVVTLQRVFYHPEAITLELAPAGALAPVLSAARESAREALGQRAPDDSGDWAPHLTLGYSTADQPAGPVIAELGRVLPSLEVTISEMSLVVQNGPEDGWDWRVEGTARLLGTPVPADI